MDLLQADDEGRGRDGGDVVERGALEQLRQVQRAVAQAEDPSSVMTTSTAPLAVSG